MIKNGLDVFGSALIVAGTAIGAGMLALPVVTGPSGFIPSLVVLFASWAFMTITGLLFAELSIWLKKDVNILTMAQTTLGHAGKLCTWFIYLFLFYSLLVAYLVGGGNLLSDLYGEGVSEAFRIAIFAIIFVSLIVAGRYVVDPINRALMFGLFAAYVGFVYIGAGSIKFENWQHIDWSQARWALPVAFTSFGFQGTVPTLCCWMQYDRRKIHQAIILGTSMTLVVYAIWQALFLGIVPLHGPKGLHETLHAGRDAVYPLQFFTHSALVWTFGKLFAFCAIATSFIGVGIGVIDFLADGLHVKKKGFLNYALLVFLAFGIPLVFALLYPNIFIHALSLAGGFGSALLLGLLPVIMVWRAKYGLGKNFGAKSMITTRAVLSILILFIVFELFTQIEFTLKI